MLNTGIALRFPGYRLVALSCHRSENTAGRSASCWVTARVKLLQSRPMQCYRCLQKGHVRAQCTSDVDRSEQCYRYGQPGHRAVKCTSEPKCSLWRQTDQRGIGWGVSRAPLQSLKNSPGSQQLYPISNGGGGCDDHKLINLLWLTVFYRQISTNVPVHRTCCLQSMAEWQMK